MDVPKIMYYRIGPTRSKNWHLFRYARSSQGIHGSCFTCQWPCGARQKRQGGKAKGDFKFSLVRTLEPEAM